MDSVLINMIPYKYKSKKLNLIFLRNLEERCNYFIKITGKDNEFKPFQSNPSNHTSNPTFEVNETNTELMNGFNSLESCLFICLIH